MMKLNRLCYVLPEDSDANPSSLYNHHRLSAPNSKHHHKQLSPSPYPSPPSVSPQTKHGRTRTCHEQAVALVGRLLRRVYAGSHCCSAPRSAPTDSDAFHDAAGVEIHHNAQHHHHTASTTHNNNNNNNSTPRIFSYAELYIGTKGFSSEELLGSGGFGRVYRAVLPGDGTVAAVKCLLEQGEHFEKTFMAELVAVAHLRHRNLVSLRGWCVHEDQLLLVYDYMPNRSLDRILFRSSPAAAAAQSARHSQGYSGGKQVQPPAVVVLDWERRKRIVRGLAAALFYLHEQLEAQIIHRDVKASNVMLDSHFNARLGDFGLARWLEHEVVGLDSHNNDDDEVIKKTNSMRNHHHFRLAETTKIGGTIGYLPPESFQRRKYKATAKSDVFSFGVVVLEVASGRRSVDLAYPDDRIVLLDWVRRLADEGKVGQAGDPKLLLPDDGSYKVSEMEVLVHLGLLCTLQDPKSRPTMRWAVEVLSGNVPGKLPALPSFKLQPLYISVCSSPNSASTTTTPGSKSPAADSVLTSTTTTTAASTPTTIYITAGGKTLFVTAETGDDSDDGKEVAEARRIMKGRNPKVGNSNSNSSNWHANNFPLIETPREISYAELVAATNNFSDDQRIAEVDFGTAYHGFIDNNSQPLHVMVKRLGMKTCPALRTRFTMELRNLGRLRHRNLIQLRGWCTEHGEMLIVYDYMATRLLSNLLFHHNNAHTVLQWCQRYNIIKSLASAILYLHEEWDEQVIHRHITSSSIVLDLDMNPRLTSFALAEFLTRNEQDNHHIDTVAIAKSSARGIFGYMSPEYVESGEANTAADIYSFGVVVLEVVTGQRAVDFRRPEVLLVQKVHELMGRKRSLEELVDREMDGKYDCQEFSRLMRLALACTNSSAESRPSIRHIVSILDGNDQCFVEFEGNKERVEEWKHKNASSMSLIRRIQALGIQ